MMSTRFVLTRSAKVTKIGAAPLVLTLLLALQVRPGEAVCYPSHQRDLLFNSVRSLIPFGAESSS